MVTAERVYEVFGITPGPWEQYENGDIGSCVNKHTIVDGTSIWHGDSSLMTASPEMLVASINEAIFIEKEGVRSNQHLVKVIESADSKNRPWSELLKELQK